ncbi:hypothetical protein EVAR_38878_1 [Eumeta japonica]|uniref:Uncharacterized protein n=1 Tax=Eumeta variegata TaxID=151549 RepID=A0A4C1X8G2_EUMVA|nr:hypothetical protein EVAR_38878_1 [Eumeta japonica]
MLNWGWEGGRDIMHVFLLQGVSPGQSTSPLLVHLIDALDWKSYFSQEVGNALVTFLVLRVSMGGSVYLPFDASPVHLPLEYSI